MLSLCFWPEDRLLRRKGPGGGGGAEQAAPESSEFTTVTISESAPGADTTDIFQVTCPGKTFAIGAFACDDGALDDQFIVSIVAATPNSINVTHGDRGFIRGPSAPGGCTIQAFTFRPSPSQGTIKAYVSVGQTADSSPTSYTLTINCFGDTTTNPVVKLLRDPD